MTTEKWCRLNPPEYSLIFPDGVTILIHGFSHAYDAVTGEHKEDRVYISYTDENGHTTFGKPKMLPLIEDDPSFMVNGLFLSLSNFERV